MTHRDDNLRLPVTQMMSNMVITGGTFNQHAIHKQWHIHKEGPKDGFERLQEAVASAAFHNSSERSNAPKCHPNTRIRLIQKVTDWILGLDESTQRALIMWIRGAAGGGKSAIAQTLAERCEVEGYLLASFFFSRSDPARSHARSLCPTIAYQICIAFPECREYIVAAIDHDPLIFTRLLSVQFQTLIVDPIRSLVEAGMLTDPKSRRLVIVDGLDECTNSEEQRQILDILLESVTRHRTPLIFLVCSRPDHDISIHFNSEDMKDVLANVHLNYEWEPHADIRLFLEDKFSEIVQKHPFRKSLPPSWPGDGVIQKLARKSSGQFIYASTVVKYLSSTRHQPDRRLEIILNLRSVIKDHPMAELDALYIHILSSIENADQVLNILGFYMTMNPDLLPETKLEDIIGPGCDRKLFTTNGSGFSMVEKALALSLDDVEILFCDLHSLIELSARSRPRSSEFLLSSPRQHTSCRFLHASFPDFLLDRKRSQQFYIDISATKMEHYSACISYLNNSLNSQSTMTHERGYRHCNLLRLTVFYLVRMPPTDELLFKIQTFSVVPLVEKYYQYDVAFSMEIVAVFLSWLQTSTTALGKEIYLRHFQSFDQFLMSQLDRRFMDDRFILAAALLSLSPSSESQIPPIAHITSFVWKKPHTDSMDIHDQCMWASSNDHTLRSWNTFLGNTSKQSTETYFSMFSNFLGDPKRSGIHYMDGEKYATAALCCLTFLCDSLAIKGPRILKWYEYEKEFSDKLCADFDLRNRVTGKKRRNNPWMWRRKWRRKAARPDQIDSVYRVKLIFKKGQVHSIEQCWHIFCPSDKRNPLIRTFWMSKKPTFDMSGLQHYKIMFEYLPKLLEHATRNQHLIEFATRRAFHPRFCAFPGEAKKARYAISLYLERMGAS